MSIDVNVNINLDASERMATMVEHICDAVRDAGTSPGLRGTLAAPCPETPAQKIPETWTEPTGTELPFAEAETPVQQPAEPAPAEDAPAATEAPAPAPPYSDEWLRGVINATRARIIGDDWEDNKTSDRYRERWKPLNNEMRKIAQQLGASLGTPVNVSKPTELPQTEIRVAFANSCDELEWKDGKLTVTGPF